MPNQDVRRFLPAIIIRVLGWITVKAWCRRLLEQVDMKMHWKIFSYATISVVLSLYAGVQNVQAEETVFPANVLWCGLHQIHTNYSDGTLTPEQSAQSLSQYFDCGSTNDHDDRMNQSEWTDTITNSNQYNVDNEFTYFFGVEWSSANQHVHYVTNDDPSAEQIDAEDSNFSQLSDLVAYLQQYNGIGQINHPARGTGGTDFSDPSRYNEQYVPLVEFINKDEWHFAYYWECAPGVCSTQKNPKRAGQGVSGTGWIKYALDRGVHLGFSAGTDYHDEMPYRPTGYTGVVDVPSRTRDGFIDALRMRHTYAAEDKIAVYVFAEENGRKYTMGDILTTRNRNLTININCMATSNNSIKEVNVFYDGIIVEKRSYSVKEVNTFYTPNPDDNKEHYIFFEVIESDGDRAWSSPMFITFSEDNASLPAPVLTKVKATN